MRTSTYKQKQQVLDALKRRLLEALRIAPERADLHVLLGTIMLSCPQEDADIEQNAVREVEQALALDPAFAPAYDLQAQVGAENRARAEIGAPLLVERQACRALQLDPGLPGPRRTLGVIYARHGLADQARAQFVQYGQAAAFEWQRHRFRAISLGRALLVRTFCHKPSIV